MFLCLLQVCFGVCLYGLYHGLVFLPALLALIGPESHNSVAPYPGTPRSPRTPSSSSRVLSPREKKSCNSDEKVNDEQRVEAVSWEEEEVRVFTVEGQSGGPTQGS